ncbi:MAG: D-alanyl-D-alanine carboxypeptidase/D-alanyl-D-alanine-endopeptidase [Balneolaceae bacterium]|nr:D-alanyl-D-alanine carboxypeptidase/D-alanyl-D-alanine-endopeptidase [Balneolaceae bacterium]
MKQNRAVLIAIVLFGSFLFSHGTTYAQFSSNLSSIIDNSRASNAVWSVQVRDSSGVLLEDLNGSYLMRPASNFKLVSSGVFLEKLGPDYRFETTLYGRGKQIENSWVGDLIIKGSGDPTINGLFTRGNALFLFEKWVQVLQERGIRQIDGNLIGFDGVFDDVPYPKGWEWDDLSYYYAPEISALSFNSNVVDLEVTANGRVGTVPEIQWFPFNTPYVEFINEQQITAPGTRFNESYRRELGTNIILLRSTLPQGYYETEPLTVTAPTHYFLDTMFRYFNRRGIDVTGHIFSDNDFYRWSDDGLEILDIHRSEPLHRMVNELNKESNNFIAEMLLKKVGAEEYGVQGTTDLGLQVLKYYMAEMGFDTTNVSLRDASGMAPATLLMTDDLNRFLISVRDKEYYPYFYNSLARSGVSGTLGHRFRNSSVRDNFKGKTGFVSGVRALSGYLDTDSGNQLAVTIITNNYTVQTSHVDFIHQRILEYLQSRY